MNEKVVKNLTAPLNQGILPRTLMKLPYIIKENQLNNKLNIRESSFVEFGKSLEYINASILLKIEIIHFCYILRPKKKKY